MPPSPYAPYGGRALLFVCVLCIGVRIVDDLREVDQRNLLVLKKNVARRNPDNALPTPECLTNPRNGATNTPSFSEGEPSKQRDFEGTTALGPIQLPSWHVHKAV